MVRKLWPAWLALLLAAPAHAATGFNLSLESVFAPLAKEVEKLNETGSAGQARFGRETAEFIGIAGFHDLNLNWRVLYGLHATLIGAPLLKATGSLAFMINTLYPIPLRPYVFLGVDPVISANTFFPPFGITLHAGLGIDYVWNNTLYTQLALRLYLLNPYGAEDARLQTEWNPGTFSLSAGLGYQF